MRKIALKICTASFAFAGCLGLAQESLATSDLAIGSPLTAAYLIDAQAQSCVDRLMPTFSPSFSVQPYYFSVPSLTLAWKNHSASLAIEAIEVTVPGAQFWDGVYKCNIVGDELAAMFSPNGHWNGIVPPAGPLGPTVYTSVCSLRCGGVALEKHASFQAKGEIKVIGFEVDPKSGEQKPVEASLPIHLIQM